MSSLTNRASRLQAGDRSSSLFWRFALLIWGLQWILSSAFGQLELFGAPAWLVPASFWAAMLATAFCLLPLRKNRFSLPLRSTAQGWRMWVLLLLLLFAALLPFIIPGIYLAEFYRTTALAAFYLMLGEPASSKAGKLGLWLILLMAATLVFYLGFAPFLLGVLGGCSLIACAVIIL
ncbi:hypothetical protein [Gorillibacterium timonense]|uniref:hypothetical protein n=1 Tax=Gorillibacterium timonense TaxID=1689269 RepID=UPI00071E2263|nr:hypothetical protein [Gorillibacterium timonense]